MARTQSGHHDLVWAQCACFRLSWYACQALGLATTRNSTLADHKLSWTRETGSIGDFESLVYSEPSPKHLELRSCWSRRVAKEIKLAEGDRHRSCGRRFSIGGDHQGLHAQSVMVETPIRATNTNTKETSTRRPGRTVEKLVHWTGSSTERSRDKLRIGDVKLKAPKLAGLGYDARYRWLPEGNRRTPDRIVHLLQNDIEWSGRRI